MQEKYYPPQTTPTFDMFEIKNQNTGIEDYIGYIDSHCPRYNISTLPPPPPPPRILFVHHFFFFNFGNSMKREENMKFKKKNSNFIFLNI